MSRPRRTPDAAAPPACSAAAPARAATPRRKRATTKADTPTKETKPPVHAVEAPLVMNPRTADIARHKLRVVGMLANAALDSAFRALAAVSGRRQRRRCPPRSIELDGRRGHQPRGQGIGS